VLFCLVDHFEPVADAQVEAWLVRYPRLASRHRDSDGRCPQHTWFYPGEQYREDYLESLAGLCRRGCGDIELHLHHGFDTAETLKAKITDAVRLFTRHGALVTSGPVPLVTYGFIHGNMALDNSREDPRYCGVNNELEVLEATGCYADFSMPTAPARSQTRKINAVYYAVDDPSAPKSHDTGRDAQVGQGNAGLLIIQGPLGLDWRNRKLGLLPRIDAGEITGRNPGTRARIARWVRQRVHAKGRPDWIVVKVSCHGAEPRHWEALLGGAADAMYSTLETEFRDRAGFRLHYVTARELYNIVKAAEAGKDGDPGAFRDYVIPPYGYAARVRRAHVRDSRRI
jgi:hypothetical protein